jgi:hypothetical protein
MAARSLSSNESLDAAALSELEGLQKGAQKFRQVRAHPRIPLNRLTPDKPRHLPVGFVKTFSITLPQVSTHLPA